MEVATEEITNVVVVTTRVSDVKEISSRQIMPNIQLPEESKVNQEGLKFYSFIELNLPGQAEVTMQFYDSSGQEIAPLISQRQFSAGTHQLTFSPEHYTEIPCLYRLSVRSEGKVYVEVKRLR